MTNLYFQTEGTKATGESYESSACLPLDGSNRRFAHELLDEFLDALARDPSTARIEFGACALHQHSNEA